MPQKRRNPPARYTLPAQIDPPHICFQVEVPNDIHHIMAFLGQIRALGRAYAWGDDSSHTALQVAAVWDAIYDKLQAGLCDSSSGLSAGADEGVEQMIRQNPTNPCLLETSINGTDWCAFADLSKCVPGGSQPGAGTPQPAPNGGQQCYHAAFTASNKWLLPTQVSAGDVLTITNAKGAASDGTVVWYCPSGALFQLGACFGSGNPSGGDPLNTSAHMMLIAKINGVYYPMYNTSLTIPGGVSAASVEFQVNDSSLTDNYGELTFDVCITNNQAATWTHTFDFTQTDGLFTTYTVAAGTAGVYSPGVGWINGDFQSPLNSFYRGAIIYRTFSSRTLTHIKMYYDLSGKATNQPDNNNELVIFQSGTATFLAKTFAQMSNGNGQTAEWNGSQAVNRIDLELWSSFYGAPATYAGSTRIYKLEVSGIGTDPFL